MGVRVVEARQHHAAAQIDDARRRSAIGKGIGIVADIGDAALRHDQRAGPGMRDIGRIDRAAGEDDVASHTRLCRDRQKQQRRDGSQQSPDSSHSLRANARMLFTNSAGFSIAAKWPPLSN